NRFTHEASEVARHVLHMCIRALDYLPPVEITFGDYLRAILTADHDADPADRHRYRVAFLAAFLGYGLFRPAAGALSVETFLWPAPLPGQAAIVAGFIQELSRKHTSWNLPRDRKAIWALLRNKKVKLAAHLKAKASEAPKGLGGIDLGRRFQVKSL